MLLTLTRIYIPTYQPATEHHLSAFVDWFSYSNLPKMFVVVFSLARFVVHSHLTRNHRRRRRPRCRRRIFFIAKSFKWKT